MGYSAIVYLAALSGGPVDLYEGTKAEGADKLRQILSIDLPDDIELPEGPEESPRSRRKARTSESGIPQKDSSSRPPTRSMSAAKHQAFWPPPLA